MYFVLSLLIITGASVDSDVFDASPVCTMGMTNGQIFSSDLPQANDGTGHRLTIENGRSSDAFVKIEDTISGRYLKFFIARGQSASLIGMPDGAYRIQYALGGVLAADCETLVRPESVAEFPNPDRLFARKVSDGIMFADLTYTLFTVSGGKVSSHPIEVDTFNKD